jgi:uncharacterized protein
MLNTKIINQIKTNIGSITPIIEPVTSCNLNCSYCFVGNKKNDKMKLSTLRKIITSIIIHNGNNCISKFIWHGGEPLLAGIDFFKEIVKIQNEFKSKGYRILNAIQTNLTLLNDDYIDFFIKHEFGVGTSIDGTKELHDLNRNNTFDIVFRNLQIAQSKGLHIGVICILTKDTLQHINEIYNFFRKNKVDFTLSPVIPNGRYSKDILTPEDYYNALKELFDLWYYDSDCKIRVNPCGSIIQSILLKGINLSCIHSENCLNHFVTFLPNGDVYPCNRFTDYEQFHLGNIDEMNFPMILNSEKRLQLLSRTIENIESCKRCEFRQYCKGGCMNHAYEFYQTIYERDYYCKAFFKIFNYIKQKVDNSIKKSILQTKINQV